MQHGLVRLEGNRKSTSIINQYIRILFLSLSLSLLYLCFNELMLDYVQTFDAAMVIDGSNTENLQKYCGRNGFHSSHLVDWISLHHQ